MQSQESQGEAHSYLAEDPETQEDHGRDSVGVGALFEGPQVETEGSDEEHQDDG